MIITTQQKYLTLQGTLGLSIAMGIGRFFYTPMLPIMIVALNWSDSISAWVATANYLGYLIGSLALSKHWLKPTRVLYHATLVASTALLAGMTITDIAVVHIVIRFLAGFASVVIFVCITQFAVHNVKDSNLVGIIYGGVGFGITVSGVVVWLLSQTLNWQGLWLIAAIVSGCFSILAWSWPIPQQESTNAQPPKTARQGSSSDSKHRFAFRLLDGGYFFQGFGYIIIGTYLVVLAGPTFGDSAAALTWVLAGLAAIPAPYFWSIFARRFSRRTALLTCYALQVIGAIAAIFGTSGFILVVAAILFGATFMGVTMLTISTGVEHHIPGGAARLTTWYSLGQVVGPAVIGVGFSDSITAAFIVASAAIIIGLLATQFSKL